MAAISLLKFSQGARVGGNGRALIVDAGVLATVENSDNTDVQSWRLELLAGPPGSSFEQLPGTPTLLAEHANDAVPTADITPQALFYGCYRIRQTVYPEVSYGGAPDVDIRNICVLTPNQAIVLPPYQKLPDPLPLPGEGKPGSKPDELNFEDQPFGWSGPNYDHPVYGQTFVQFRLVNAALEMLDAGTGGGGGGLFLVTVAGAGPHAVVGNGASTETLVLVDCSAGPVQVDLPDALVNNERFRVVDASGDSLTNNITVTGGINSLNSSGVIAGNYGNKAFVADDTFLGGGYFTV